MVYERRGGRVPLPVVLDRLAMLSTTPPYHYVERALGTMSLLPPTLSFCIPFPLYVVIMANLLLPPHIKPTKLNRYDLASCSLP